RGTASERPDCPRRARGRNRAVVAALVAGEERRRSSGTDFRRSRHRQIATYSCSFGKSCARTAYTITLFLLASAHRQCVLSDHWSDGTSGGIVTRRYAPAETRQARCSARADFDLDPGHRAYCGDAFATE